MKKPLALLSGVASIQAGPPTGTIAESEAGGACMRRENAVSRRGLRSTQHHRDTHGVEEHAKTALWRLSPHVAVAACIA